MTSAFFTKYKRTSYVETTPVLPSVRLSDLSRAKPFVGLGIGVLYKKLLTKLEFRSNRFSDSHNFFTGVIEFPSVRSMISLVKVGTGIIST